MDREPATLPRVLQGAAARHGARVALRMRGREVRYAGLWGGALAMAGGLRAAGVMPGDRVVLMLPNSPEFVLAYFAIQVAGAIVVPASPLLKPDELAYLLGDAEPRAVLSVSLCSASIREARARARMAVPAFMADPEAGALAEGDRGWRDLMAGGPGSAPPPPEDAEAVAACLYTSGTTGRPKGVTTGLWDEATARAVFEDEASVWHFDRRDLHMVCSPMYHTVSIRFAGGTLLSGGSLAILSHFDAATALGVLRRERPSTAFLVPTHLHRILGQPDLGADETFGSLRLLVHAGAPCPEPLKRAAMARVRPGALWEFYGSTEAQFTVCAPEEWLEHPGTVGRARVGRRLWIAPWTDDDGGAERGDDRHDDGSGTVWCDMPRFARFSYWRNPEATAAAWRGPACTVGDVGRLDADGYLYLTGRRQDLIISGGVNVYPVEVENVLAAVAGVREVAVFGMPDAEWGQRVCAAFVFDGPPSGRAAAEDALRAAATAHLAPYKRPKTYVAAAELPHTATGKLVRRAVPEHLGLEA